LDDAFVIIGSYTRTYGTNIEKRIELTMKEVSLSIFLTSLTSALAFAIGISSDIPSVRWLCLYACPSIVIDFAYQITFFIALLVIDERRIQANRRDCCFCIQVRDSEADVCKSNQLLDDGPKNKENAVHLPPLTVHELHWSDRFMAWYADKLLCRTSQVVAMVGFVSLFIVSLYFTTQMTQHFDMNNMVPHDSYLRDYYSSLKEYSATRNGISSYAFFRDIDQSQPEVQFQMLQFIDDLADKGAIASSPANFWLHDFLQFANESVTVSSMAFDDQIKEFLSEPLYRRLYDDHIVRDSDGTITDSRCEIYVNVDISDAKAGIAELMYLQELARSQAANEGLGGSEWTMFTYHDMYNLWEFYMKVVSELTVTTIIGVFSVSAVALLLIPHWTAVLIVTPMIICLYVDLLGKLYRNLA
jgi:predicted RND superfamily exporter protein